jgi:hypothetical protein
MWTQLGKGVLSRFYYSSIRNCTMNSHICQIIWAHGPGAFFSAAWSDAGQQRPGPVARSWRDLANEENERARK